MTSRRKLKKNINETMDLLYTDCVFHKLFGTNVDQNILDALISQIAKAHEEFVSRVSVSEGREVKGRTKTYYRKLKEDFDKQITSLEKQISGLR